VDIARPHGYASALRCPVPEPLVPPPLRHCHGPCLVGRAWTPGSRAWGPRSV